MAKTIESRIHWGYPIVLLIAAALGLTAAFTLTMDDIALLKDPDVATKLQCYVSPFIQCAKNIQSWQGSLFGFPNPVLGLMCWPIIIAVAMALLAGARFARWFWILFNLAVAGASLLCAWFLTQSFYSLGTICVWCVLTWSVTHPTFVITTGIALKNGVWGERARPAGRFIVRWSPVIVILVYLLIATLAQLKFDLLGYFFR